MRPRILLIALSDWFGPTRLPQALRAAGFDVGLIAETSSLIAQSSYIDYRYPLSPHHIRMGYLRPLIDTITAFAPRIVIPCDEATSELMQSLALSWDGARTRGGLLRVPVFPPTREVLLRSLGEPRGFNVRSSRMQARKAATAMGIAVPPSAPIPYLQVAESFARDHGWPVVLMRDKRGLGRSVRLCATSEDLRRAYGDLTREMDAKRSWKEWVSYAGLAVASGFRLAGDLTVPPQSGPELWIEAHVPGRPASYSAVANEGRWLGGIAAVAEPVGAEHIADTTDQATTVVRLIQDPAMQDVAQKMIGRLGYTGFCGLDFIREEATGKLWFLKFNARPTQVSHLGHLAGGDLCAALYAAVSGSFPVPQRVARETTVALFPQDWIRDPNAKDRGAEHMDLPQDDERLMQALLARVPRISHA